MRRRRLLLLAPLLLVSGLILAACEPADETPEATETPQLGETPGVTGTPAIDETPTPDVTETPAVTPTPGMTPTPPAGAPATIQAEELPDQPTVMYLADDLGKTIYMFAQDEQGAEESACTGDCLLVWHPVVTTVAEAEAGEGVQADLLGTFEREDGLFHVTYDGWPLYTYEADREEDAINGHGVNNAWFIISPDGEPLEDIEITPEPGVTETPDADLTPTPGS